MAEQQLLDDSQTFASFDLDDRLLRGIANMGFKNPTLVQAAAIPLALEGKDVLARARTGSGKTAAYSLPVLQRLLHIKSLVRPDNPTEYHQVRALVLVPTRELSAQVYDHFKAVLTACPNTLNLANLGDAQSLKLQVPLLKERPDIIITTPHRIVAHLKAGHVALQDSLEYLVVDEADLILSFGHREDMIKLATFLPKICQTMLMSATLTDGVQEIKELLLRNPAILKLQESEDVQRKLTQYSLQCTEDDKYLLIYVLLKLKLLPGKCLIFVNDIDRCYRVKLFLEQFSIQTCVLNSELPFTSRHHIVQEFNRGVYQYLIATDESTLCDYQDLSDHEDDEADETTATTDDVATTTTTTEDPTSAPKEAAAGAATPKKSVRMSDQEYGVARGIDFENAHTVVNFDFPRSVRSYVHRVGRTARGQTKGQSLSFVVPGDQLNSMSRKVSAHDEKVYERVVAYQQKQGQTIKPFVVDPSQLEGFRYRTMGALSMVSRLTVQKARVKDIKRELVNSEKLQSHFQDKPQDLDFLRHDKALQPNRVKAYMSHLPEYMIPKSSELIALVNPAQNDASGIVSAINANGMQKVGAKLKRGERKPKRLGGKRPRGRSNNPLKSFRTTKRK
ncbi:ATP-dependent DNA/RNA helicase [Dimargaris verticillata]|uniref:RNA helicase n=1 Tax=Dimargaris verticillata TaxID=2761393 RepID=A0A9W8B452_9FUNG|nr:ATP-dependent DNA/RNA helicase [Dimargaris verticillata]